METVTAMRSVIVKEFDSAQLSVIELGLAWGFEMAKVWEVRSAIGWALKRVIQLLSVTAME